MDIKIIKMQSFDNYRGLAKSGYKLFYLCQTIVGRQYDKINVRW